MKKYWAEAISLFIVVIAALFLKSDLACAAQINLALNLTPKISMETLAKNVGDVQSPHFQKYYTPQEIRDLTAPDESAYLDLLTNLKNEGLIIKSSSKTHLLIKVSGEQALIENLFSTQLRVTPVKGLLRVRQVGQNAVIPLRFNLIKSVSGLDNTEKSFSHVVYSNIQGKLNPSVDVPSVSPQKIKELYKLNPIYNSGILGEGQEIAIATYKNFNIQDVRDYFSKSLLTTPFIELVEFNGVPDLDSVSAIETEADAELAGMIAPAAKIHVFASSTNNNLGEIELFTSILDDNRSKIVNYSWGRCEDAVNPQHKIAMDDLFARAVAQGINIFVASGDSGSAGCNSDLSPDPRPIAGWPASNPYVVSVGGTTIDQGLSVLRESAWSMSGGGVSGFYSLPNFQLDFKSPFAQRSIPDVSFNADNLSSPQDIYVHNPNSGIAEFIAIGGTSIASPQWAGFLALVNQARGARGSVGFIDPIIYKMDSMTRQNVFHDVVSGGNGAFKAGLGWDAATGWGSYDAANLLNYLLEK
jgi:kumamolisin